MAFANKLVIFYLTKKGHELGQRIARDWPDAVCARFSEPLVKSHWAKGAYLVFIMATGIVVRTIAPLLKDKRTDPAVVVLDELGRHVVSLLSGHIGGANRLATELAAHLLAAPVITTASDANGLPSIDLWAEEQGLAIENWKQLPQVATRLLNRGSLSLFSDVHVDAPSQFRRTEKLRTADLIVTSRLLPDAPGRRKSVVLLRPKNVVAGVGCNSGTEEQEIEGALRRAIEDAGLSFLSLKAIATIDKKGEEPGLRSFASNEGLPLLTFSPEELNRVPGVTPSEAARKATGAQAVAEPAAILGAVGGSLLARKVKIGNVTVALAVDDRQTAKADRSDAAGGQGMLYVVGTGPGNGDDLTPRALRAIQESDVIVGYGPYLDLVETLVSGKETVSSGMAQEIDRCRKAIDLARAGKIVSVISGGDPGIYAMAGLVLELLRRDQEATEADLPVRIIPGISALNACAARIGAPLMHDFAVISLSDRLTSWKMIEARLEAAARADFVIVLYNPKSKGRPTNINRAQRLILKHRPEGTPVGIVKSVTREDEKAFICDLGHLPFDEIDMRTTVIIGNSKSLVWDKFMITPRGYENKKSWQESRLDSPDTSRNKRR